MLEVMTSTDIGMTLVGVAMVIIGALGTLEVLTLPAFFFVVLTVGVIYVPFIAGVEYSRPRRA